MRVVHCYGQTPEMKAAMDGYWQASDRDNLERPQYDRYEEGRAWQPTVCGIHAPDIDVLRPSDFVATVNHTDPSVDQAELGVALEFPGLPYTDGDAVLDAQPCAQCKEAAPACKPPHGCGVLQPLLFSAPFAQYGGCTGE